MNQKQSEDFDDYVKGLADQADSPFHEQSWHAMEILLNKLKKRRFGWWYWIAGTAILGSIILAIQFLPISHNLTTINGLGPDSPERSLNRSDKYAIKITSAKIFEQGLPSTGLPDHKLTGESAEPGSQESHLPLTSRVIQPNYHGPSKTTTIRTNKTLASQPDISLRSIPGYPHSSSKSSTKLTQSINLIPKDSQHPDTRTEVSQTGTSTTVAQQNRVSNSLVTESDDSFDSRDQMDVIPFLPMNGLTLLPYNRSIPLREGMDRVPTEPLAVVHRALVVGLGWSPEYTSVVQRSFGAIGNTYGLELGYSINRWLMSVGLQASTKHYDAMKEDYELPANSYYKNLKINNIHGTCTVLQLPVSLRYKLLTTKGFGLTLNGGINSMRMNKEDYTYDYYHANYKPGHSSSEYATKNWHWLAAVSTGISLQKSICPHIFMSISPYYQLPLKGVGEGNVHLRSFGSRISVSWSLLH